MNKKIIVGVAVAVMAVAFVLSGQFYQSGKEKKLEKIATKQSAVFARDYSQTKGAADAKVVITEFFDPGCETCRQLYPFVKQLIADYPGKVKVVLRYVALHQGSDIIVRILEAARRQDKYWETLELMFETQPVWASHHQPAPEKVWEYLPKLGLDIDQLKTDMDDPAVVSILEQDMADARRLNVRKTPEFFVNGKPLPRFGPRELQALVQSEVAAQYGSR